MNKWTLWESVSNSCKESGGCQTRSARSDHGRSARSCWKLKFWKTRSQRSQPWRRASRRTSRPPACPPHASLKPCSLLWPLTAVCVSWMDHRGENKPVGPSEQTVTFCWVPSPQVLSTRLCSSSAVCLLFMFCSHSLNSAGYSSWTCTKRTRWNLF